MRVVSEDDRQPEDDDDREIVRLRQFSPGSR